MVYFAPTVTANGAAIPTYLDIENYLVDSAKSIFGQDIYLENDSQDFQFIAALSKAIYDTMLFAQQAYNTRGPSTAIGVGLDGVVSLNGIARRPATNSIATVTLTGTPFTLIQNGVVRDISGNRWTLPANVIIGSNGTVSVTATCQTSGEISALPGQINIIETPTFGWSSVTNPTAATPGQPEETDAELRSRQALSVANPSQALVDGILGSILAVPNVISARIYENDTNLTQTEINGVTNPDGFPPHSITCVIDGGDGQTLANTIDLRKTPGCYTNGDQVYSVVDENGVSSTIRFYRPVKVGIDVEITITALNGYTTALGTAMQQSVVDYLNSLEIGQSVIWSEVMQAALSVDTNKYPRFSLTQLLIGFHGSGNVMGETDLSLNFDEKATTQAEFVSLIVNS